MEPNTVNDQIMDSVSSVQDFLLGQLSPSMAMLNSVMAETIGMSMHNAVTAQHNAQMLNAATTTSTCAKILSVVSAPPPPPAQPIVVPPVVVVAAPSVTTVPAVDTTHEDVTNA